MNLAWVSVGALITAIVVSCFSQLNVGILALAFAWIIGVYFAGMTLAAVFSGFPIALFLTLTGVTLLFTQAQLNGTLDKAAHRAMQVCRGNVGLMPIMFFIVTSALSSLGPGNIASAALVAPVAMAVAGRAAVPMFLMAIMVGNGASAGSLSPFAPAGIVVNGIMNRIGLGGHESLTYLNNLLVHAVVAIVAYFILGGWKLFRFTYAVPPEDSARAASLDAKNWITLGVIATLIVSVIWFKVDVGMGAFLGASLLTALRLADHKESIKRVPWGVIIMVCGVTVLISDPGKDAGTGFVYSAAGAAGHQGHDHRRDRVRDRTGLGIQQHVRRGPAGLSAHDSRPGRAAGRRRSDRHRLVDEHRRTYRGRVAALHDRRPLYRRDPGHRGSEGPVQQADDLGAVDDGRRRDRLLRVVRSVRHPLAAACIHSNVCLKTDAIPTTISLDHHRNRADTLGRPR